MSDLVYITDHPKKTQALEACFGDIVCYTITQPLFDLPKERLGIDIVNDFNSLLEPTNENKPLLKELRSLYGQTVYIFTEANEEGVRLLHQLYTTLKLSPEAKHYACLPTWNESDIKNFLNFLQPLPVTLVDAAEARRTLDRLAGSMLSEYFTLLRKKKKEKIPASMSYVASCLLSDLTKYTVGLNPNDPFILRLTDSTWTAPEILYDESTPLQHQRPKSYPNQNEATESFRALRQLEPEIQIVQKDRQQQWEPPLPHLTLGRLLGLALHYLNYSPFYTLSLIDELVFKGYIMSGILSNSTVKSYGPQLIQYIQENELNAYISKAHAEMGTRYSVFQPLIFTTEGLQGDVLELHDLVLSYYPHTIRKPLQKEVEYVLYQMGPSYFRSEKLVGWAETLPLKLSKWPKYTELSREDLLLEYVPLCPIKNFLTPEQLFTQTTSYEGALMLARTYETLLKKEQMCFDTKTRQVRLKPLGYAIGSYVHQAFSYHSTLKSFQYLDQVMYALKRGQRDKLYFLHTWYQSFRDEQEKALGLIS